MVPAVPGETQTADRIDDGSRGNLGADRRTRLQDHREFVATQAGNNVFGTKSTADGVGNPLQQGITGGVTAGVVDQLEMVEVDEHELVLAAPSDRLVESAVSALRL